MEESFVLKSLRSDSLSLVEKINLVRNMDRVSEAVKSLLKEEKGKIFDPLDARGMIQFIDENPYDFSDHDLVPKIVPGSLTSEEVISTLLTWPHISVQRSLIDALMRLVDWKTISKDRLVRDFHRSHAHRIWEQFVLELKLFTEAELLELLAGQWKGASLKRTELGMHGLPFKRMVLTSPIVSKEEKFRIATDSGPINGEEYFQIVLKHNEFSDEELLSIAQSGRVAKCYTLIHSYLKKYRNLLKVARLLRSKAAWDTFIEKGALATKTPRQILRAARVSQYPKIWSLYFEKATEPAVTHEELMKRGAKVGKYALWAVFLAHVDYSKLTLEWITDFIRGCASATDSYRNNRRYSRSDESFNFEAAMVIAQKMDWKAIPYAQRIELLKIYPYDPWREAIATSLDEVQLKDIICFSSEQNRKFLNILQAKAL